MKQENKHYLVVGAGLAGCCVAIHLLKGGARVTMLDSGENHSSAIAAGLINPLVFRRMTKSWRLDEFIPYLKNFYRFLEEESGASFFHPVAIRRLFAHEQEREFWLKRQGSAEFSDYMEVLTDADLHYPHAANTCGTGRVKQAAYVQVEGFLRAAKDWIKKNGTLLSGQMKYSALKNCKYAGVQYAGVIFCEGYQGKANPWFSYLPLGQTKGETLNIKSLELPEHESLNLKCFVLPLGDQTFKIGATYGWHDPTTHTTEEGRIELLEKLSALTDGPLEILRQEAGVRPTSIDRRPFIGPHPEEARYYVFNGLGTKGYMIAPLLAKEFSLFLLEGEALDPEVDCVRYSDLLAALNR